MELKWQPFPHPSPTTVAHCKPEAAVLPGDMAPLAAGVARAAVEVEALAELMVEEAPAEAVLTEAVEEVARVEVVLTEEAEAPVEEAPVEEVPVPAVPQVGAAAGAIARIKTRTSSRKVVGGPGLAFETWVSLCKLFTRKNPGLNF